ncbi:MULTISPECIES: CdaR family transcriptional regulator [unclassified Mycobacterium]|uniref:PucR family transcriptional regulator n=1 Tax=unclassified Mycobacterium TaxID=2642494 RepID=UPI0007FFC614|nr:MULTISPECIES: helix-turn-helix domain-containing protein [unclassified Mycobacterium]OBG61246.1 transcriptional regulator [Mycobacterium sp. E188]OBG68180.1 transcriptional regulator [Mycobacterium sp. E735]OBH39744.1 transcriptional regulator [Mycobacterium sp. E183]
MAGVGLGQLLLALDATLVSLVEAPRGLDLAVGSAALIDSDDVRLGLAAAAGSADVFFLLGVADDEALRWIAKQARERVPAAIFAKEPSTALVGAAVGAGAAVVAVEPRARWERLYQLVNHVLAHHGDRADAAEDSGTDLFGLAQSLADRIHGMVSIENAQSHVLAYSASNDEADELRRLSILGRAGPPEHLEWIGQWGIFDALRAGDGVVRVAERPELGLRPRLAVGIYQPDARRPPEFAGTIWVQQGSQPLADDAEEILRGAAVLAARIMARLAARPSTHARRVHQLLGLVDGEPDVDAVARELGLAADDTAALIGWDAGDDIPRQVRLADVMALSASAFRRDAQVASRGSRIYVLLPQTQARAVSSWVRGTVAAMRTELGVQLRAAIAAPVAGLAGIAGARAELDRVLDSAARHPISIPQVTSLAEARTTVLLDEIVTLIGRERRLTDPRIVGLRADDPVLAETLRVYLDGFGDIASAARKLRVHPNTVRYRIRRIEKLLDTSLADPEARLLFSLALRVAEGG